MASLNPTTYRSLIAAIALLAVSNAYAQVTPDASAISEVNRLGALLHAYDQAAWHGTDAVMPMLQDDTELDVRVRGYVVKQTNEGWAVGFGRLTEDGSAFAVAFEAVLDETYTALEAVAYTQAERRTGFYHRAMVARDSAMARFEPPEPVTYNTAVIPGSNEVLYVYLLPAQPEVRVYNLGADHRYTFDLNTNTITESKRLHNAILTLDLRADPPPVSFASAVLTDIPTETDVFYARSRPPAADGKVNHYVMTEAWVFMLDSTGIIAHMTREAFVNMTRSPSD